MLSPGDIFFLITDISIITSRPPALVSGAFIKIAIINAFLIKTSFFTAFFTVTGQITAAAVTFFIAMYSEQGNKVIDRL